MNMQETSVLDLADFVPVAKRSSVRPGRLHMILGAALLAAAGWLAFLPGSFLSPGALFAAFSASDSNAVAEVTFADQQAVSEMTVDDKSQLLSDGADAEARNAAIPVSGLPLDQAPGFVLGAERQGTYATALKCLTQAVYYEAAVEPLQGRRAVAQVVLNRMRHAAYPKSVCGVVYQGSERRTGCQFSFTCDGSLLRRPTLGPWREAEAVARAALAGYVEKSVGTATHYHADYVLPKWAFQLAKISQLGRHIFYRFEGNWGRSFALNGQYSAVERIPALNLENLNERLLADGTIPATEQFTPGLTVTPSVTDRHAEADVGGRIDTTKQWRLTIPDPVQASSRYRQAVESGDARPTLASSESKPIAMVVPEDLGAAKPK